MQEAQSRELQIEERQAYFAQTMPELESEMHESCQRANPEAPEANPSA